MKNNWFIFSLGVALGLILMLLLMAWRIGNIPAVIERKENQKIITACEKDLPRRRHCVLIAIPGEINK